MYIKYKFTQNKLHKLHHYSIIPDNQMLPLLYIVAHCKITFNIWSIYLSFFEGKDKQLISGGRYSEELA